MKAKYMLYMAGVVVSVGAAVIPMPIRGWVGSSPVVLAEAADKTPAATKPTQATKPQLKPAVTLPKTAVPPVLTPVEVKVPAKAAESALGPKEPMSKQPGAPESGLVPKGPTSKQPGAGAGKDGVSLERPIDGLPTRVAPGAPPVSGNLPLVGAVEVSLDPSVRPDLANMSGSRLDGYSKGIGVDLGNASDVTTLRPEAGSRLDAFSKGVFGAAEGAGVQATPGRDAVSMFGDAPKGMGSSGTSMAPVGYDDEGVHGGKGVKDNFEGTALGDFGNAIGNGLPSTNSGQMLKAAVESIDGETTKKSKDGNVTSTTNNTDGTVVITNKENGTTTTQLPDGTITTVNTETKKLIDCVGDKCEEIEEKASKTSTKKPGPDQGVALPGAIQKQVDADMARLRGIGPKHGDGAVDFGEGDTAAKDGAVRIGALPDKHSGHSGLINPGSAGATTSPPPSVNQSAPPTAADPNNIDPTED